MFGDGSGGMVCVGGVWGCCVGMFCGNGLGMVYVDGVLGDGGGMVCVMNACMCVCMYVSTLSEFYSPQCIQSSSAKMEKVVG